MKGRDLVESLGLDDDNEPVDFRCLEFVRESY
jgi:hypothetical protein